MFLLIFIILNACPLIDCSENQPKRHRPEYVASKSPTPLAVEDTAIEILRFLIETFKQNPRITNKLKMIIAAKILTPDECTYLKGCGCFNALSNPDIQRYLEMIYVCCDTRLTLNDKEIDPLDLKSLAEKEQRTVQPRPAVRFLLQRIEDVVSKQCAQSLLGESNEIISSIGDIRKQATAALVESKRPLTQQDFGTLTPLSRSQRPSRSRTPSPLPKDPKNNRISR